MRVSPVWRWLYSGFWGQRHKQEPAAKPEKPNVNGPVTQFYGVSWIGEGFSVLAHSLNQVLYPSVTTTAATLAGVPPLRWTRVD